MTSQEIEQDILMGSWLEHIKHAKDMNMIRNGAGNKYLQVANEISQQLQGSSVIKQKEE